MSAKYSITLECDDCGKSLESDPFATLELAREASKVKEWEYVRVHRVELDFCPACQVSSTRAATR